MQNQQLWGSATTADKSNAERSELLTVKGFGDWKVKQSLSYDHQKTY